MQQTKELQEQQNLIQLKIQEQSTTVETQATGIKVAIQSNEVRVNDFEQRLDKLEELDRFKVNQVEAESANESEDDE